MTTLITGATGLIGGHIARALHAEGVPLRILVRPHSRREGLKGVSFEEVLGDVRDPDSLKRAMEGVTQVVHAAGAVRIDPFAAEKLHAVNVEGTRNVLEAARNARVQRLVHLSSVAAIGGGTLDRPADETTPWRLGNKGPYWATKHEAEELVLAATRRGDFEAVVVNPAYAIGPGDVKPSSGGILLAVATGLVVVYPEGGGSFIDARDVAQGALLALRKGVPGQRYVLSGENLTYKQFLSMAAQAAGVKPPMFPLPHWLAARAGQLGDILGPRFPKAFTYVSSQVVETLFELSYVSNVKAMRDLGFSPRPVREAVRDAYVWFGEHDRLPPRLWPLGGHAKGPKRPARDGRRHDEEPEARSEAPLLH